MSDDKRTASELLKHRIVQDTAEQVGTVAKMMFDAFTGGSEAVLDTVAESFEARARGEADTKPKPRYRCLGCRGVHLEGTGCDAELPEQAPPGKIVTLRVFCTECGAESAHVVGCSKARALPAPFASSEVCAECVHDGEHAQKTDMIGPCPRCGCIGARLFRTER
jgi:hypothetical protein